MGWRWARMRLAELCLTCVFSWRHKVAMVTCISEKGHGQNVTCRITIVWFQKAPFLLQKLPCCPPFMSHLISRESGILVICLAASPGAFAYGSSHCLITRIT
jgi:hypothetical protein